MSSAAILTETLYPHSFKDNNLNYIESDNVIRHNLRNLLFAISGYITIGKYEQAQQKIEEICNIFSCCEYQEITGDVCLDKLISSKISYARSLKINLKCSSYLNKNIEIDKSDLCTIIGNALDNSIDECEKINNILNRKIHICISNIKNTLFIDISNSIRCPVDLSFRTTKNNPSSHGIGIKSISSIVKKYNGTFSASQSNNTFKISIKLKQPIC